MRAYYFDNLPGDQRLPHDYIPSQPVSSDTLTKLGINFWAIPVDGYEPKLDAIAHERGYKNRDTINVSKEGLGPVSILALLSERPSNDTGKRCMKIRSRDFLRSTWATS